MKPRELGWREKNTASEKPIKIDKIILLGPQYIPANLVKTSGPNAHPRATQAKTTLSKIEEGIIIATKIAIQTIKMIVSLEI